MIENNESTLERNRFQSSFAILSRGLSSMMYIMIIRDSIKVSSTMKQFKHT